MADPTPSLTDLLMVLDTLEWPTRPSPALNPHVSKHCPQGLLPLSVAFLARWTTCHLQSWRMLAPSQGPPPFFLFHSNFWVAFPVCVQFSASQCIHTVT